MSNDRNSIDVTAEQRTKIQEHIAQITRLVDDSLKGLQEAGIDTSAVTGLTLNLLVDQIARIFLMERLTTPIPPPAFARILKKRFISAVANRRAVQQRGAH